MKFKAPIVLIILSFFLANICFAQEFSIRFTLDKVIYDNLDSDQQSSLIQKTNELNIFVDEKIKKIIPSEIKNLITDLKIKIHFTNTPGRDGLFIPNQSGEHTINLQLLNVYSNGIYALLAHEIYHAIHYHLNPNEVAWVKEGLAQVFEFMTTQELNGMNLYAAIKNPMTPLLGNYDPAFSDPAQYGHNMLYFYYLYNRCGQDNLFWKITVGKKESNLRGSFLIDSVLNELALPNDECLNFSESAVAFEVAKMHNKVQFSNEKNKYKYFVTSSDISPDFEKNLNEKALKLKIKNMPVLSSYKVPLESFLKHKGECLNCIIYYASNAFPYLVSEQSPAIKANTDVILVKIRKN